MIELGVVGFLVLIFVISIYVLRRAQRDEGRSRSMSIDERLRQRTRLAARQMTADAAEIRRLSDQIEQIVFHKQLADR